jgi:hypothetical protein
MEEAIDLIHQMRWSGSEHAGECDEGGQGRLSQTSFEKADEGSIKTALLGELFLRHANRSTMLS